MAYNFENFVPAEQVTAYKDSLAETVDKPVELKFKSGENEIKVLVRPLLDLNTFASAVESAVSSCFDEDNKYVPWMRDVAFAHAIIAAYSNLELPSNLYDVFDLINGTDLYIQIGKAANQNQFEMLERAVDRKIQYVLDEQNSARKQELDLALATLNSVSQSLVELGEVVDAMTGGNADTMISTLKDGAKEAATHIEPIKKQITHTENGGDV